MWSGEEPQIRNDQQYHGIKLMAKDILLGNGYMTTHFVKKCEDRAVTEKMIFECLRKGTPVGRPVHYETHDGGGLRYGEITLLVSRCKQNKLAGLCTVFISEKWARLNNINTFGLGETD